MATRRRMAAPERRAELLDVAARLFAARTYDEVLMGDVAERAGVSRALLYRHFPSKHDLFAGVYQLAMARQRMATELDPSVSLTQQLCAGLDAHIDHLIANKNTVLAANRVLRGDPTIQAIISDNLAVLRQRVADAIGLHGQSRDVVSAVLMNWLVFVGGLCLDWLENPTVTRTQLRDMGMGALLGALRPVHNLDPPALARTTD